LLLLILFSACNGQTRKQKTMEEKKVNPLICDPEKGMCEVPGPAGKQQDVTKSSKQGIRVLYFTDPICSACWSIEPQLRKLQLEYGQYFYFEYHMGGLLPSWEVYNSGPISKPSDVAHHWEEMSHYFGMPIDGDVWIEDPLNSSYPSCMAYKAAELQGAASAAGFLRRIREMVFLEKKNIAKWENLKNAALQCGLDTAQFANDYKEKAPELFKQDLALAQHYGVRGFPALYFSDSLNNQTSVYGYHPYEDFENALKKLMPSATKHPFNKKDDHLFMHYQAMTTKEFSVLTGQSIEDAEKVLTSLENNHKVTRFKSKNGDLWKRKMTQQ
jgi:putative protein-disulfide isomerase